MLRAEGMRASIGGESGVPLDSVVVLPGPMGPNQKWVVLRDVSMERFKELEEAFYNVPGVAFGSYKTFKGEMDECSVIVQAFWRKSVRNNESLAVLWKTIDWELKNAMEHFTEALPYSGLRQTKYALVSGVKRIFTTLCFVFYRVLKLNK